MGGDATYRELVPPPRLAEHVWSVFVHRVPPDGGAYVHRTVPNGSAQLVWRAGEPPRLAGPRTRPSAETLAPGALVVGARLRPAAALALLGTTPGELLDDEVDAGVLWGRAGERLGERLALAGSPAAALAVLQDELAARLARPADPLVAEAVRRLRPAAGAEVAALPRALGISERQLRRRFHAAVGMGPKTLQRLLRFQLVLAAVHGPLARGQLPAAEGLARLAADAGYADQAHLTRESVRLAGMPIGAYLRRMREQCGPHHDHRASFAPLLAR